MNHSVKEDFYTYEYILKNIRIHKRTYLLGNIFK